MVLIDESDEEKVRSFKRKWVFVNGKWVLIENGSLSTENGSSDEEEDEGVGADEDKDEDKDKDLSLFMKEMYEAQGRSKCESFSPPPCSPDSTTTVVPDCVNEVSSFGSKRLRITEESSTKSPGKNLVVKITDQSLKVPPFAVSPKNSKVPRTSFDVSPKKEPTPEFDDKNCAQPPCSLKN